MAEAIGEALRAPFYWRDRELFVSASLGLALFPTDAESAEDLIKNADVGLDTAKHEGKDTFRLYEPESNRLIYLRLDLENKLRRAEGRQVLRR